MGDFDAGPDGKTIVAKMRRGRKQMVTVLIEFNLFLHAPTIAVTRSEGGNEIYYRQSGYNRVASGWKKCILVSSTCFISIRCETS